jgi:hypothetical protein
LESSPVLYWKIQTHKKVRGETRIRDELYDLALRIEGRLTQKYKERYGDMHRAMIWVKDVPEFHS